MRRAGHSGRHRVGRKRETIIGVFQGVELRADVYKGQRALYLETRNGEIVAHWPVTSVAAVERNRADTARLYREVHGVEIGSDPDAHVIPAEPIAKATA